MLVLFHKHNYKTNWNLVTVHGRYCNISLRYIWHDPTFKGVVGSFHTYFSTPKALQRDHKRSCMHDKNNFNDKSWLQFIIGVD